MAEEGRYALHGELTQSCLCVHPSDFIQDKGGEKRNLTCKATKKASESRRSNAAYGVGFPHP